MKKPFLLIVVLIISIETKAQNPFIEKCLGTWNGMMYIYNHGNLKDSVEVKFTASKTNEPKAWTWKTEYLSTKMPMTKDYVLREKDKEKNIYSTDEGGGLELLNYIAGNKMYCVFEVQNILLTSTTEIVGENIVFEVTSGKKTDKTAQEVLNYTVPNLQRVVLKRVK